MSLKLMNVNSPAELHRVLLTVHENRDELDWIKVNLNTSSLEVKLKAESNALDRLPEFRIPLKNAALEEANEIVSVLRRQLQYGDAPSATTAERLFTCCRGGHGGL
jgi:hypothetical protein